MNEYLTAVSLLERSASDAGNPIQSFNRKEYTAAFEKNYQTLLPAFDAIEHLYKTVGDPDAMIANMAQAYTSCSQKRLDEAAKRKKAQIQMDLNMHLAVYVFPAILYYKGESSQPLCDALCSAWQEAFPGSNVRPASLDQIEAGFHKKFCYITTAVCRSGGRGDDCYELNLLRSYRDGYLSSRTDGSEMIRRYYDVAPSIVKHIDERQDSDRIYQDVWQNYIRPCITMIEHGENENCAVLYEQMVDDLKARYFYLQ